MATCELLSLSEVGVLLSVVPLFHITKVEIVSALRILSAHFRDVL